jgi:hypothetical protein
VKFTSQKEVLLAGAVRTFAAAVIKMIGKLSVIMAIRVKARKDLGEKTIMVEEILFKAREIMNHRINY